jgi:hypothetical protein
MASLQVWVGILWRRLQRSVPLRRLVEHSVQAHMHRTQIDVVASQQMRIHQPELAVRQDLPHRKRSHQREIVITSK